MSYYHEPNYYGGHFNGPWGGNCGSDYLYADDSSTNPNTIYFGMTEWGGYFNLGYSENVLPLNLWKWDMAGGSSTGDGFLACGARA